MHVDRAQALWPCPKGDHAQKRLVNALPAAYATMLASCAVARQHLAREPSRGAPLPLGLGRPLTFAFTLVGAGGAESLGDRAGVRCGGSVSDVRLEVRDRFGIAFGALAQ